MSLHVSDAVESDAHHEERKQRKRVMPTDAYLRSPRRRSMCADCAADGG
jgi:hypothetical protein